MLSRLLVASIAALGLIVQRPPVVLTGTIKDCDDDAEMRVAGVTVEAFNPTHNAQIVAALKSIDTATFNENDAEAMTRFDEKYSRLMELLENSPALASGASDSDGRLTLSFPATDSVLIVGYAELEDEPYYWAHSTVAGRASSAFTLDMSRGECKYGGS